MRPDWAKSDRFSPRGSGGRMVILGQEGRRLRSSWGLGWAGSRGGLAVQAEALQRDRRAVGSWLFPQLRKIVWVNKVGMVLSAEEGDPNRGERDLGCEFLLIQFLISKHIIELHVFLRINSVYLSNPNADRF